MAQAVAEKDAESSLTEGMETMGVQEADKTEKSSQGEKEKQQADKAKAEEASEAMEQGQKQEGSSNPLHPWQVTPDDATKLS